MEGKEELLLRRGDMLVLPELDECPTRLVERGVRVWIYQLGTSPACPRLRQGCRFFVHNFWLSQQFGVHVPRCLTRYWSPCFCEGGCARGAVSDWWVLPRRWRLDMPARGPHGEKDGETLVGRHWSKNSAAAGCLCGIGGQTCRSV